MGGERRGGLLEVGDWSVMVQLEVQRYKRDVTQAKRLSVNQDPEIFPKEESSGPKDACAETRRSLELISEFLPPHHTALQSSQRHTKKCRCCT